MDFLGPYLPTNLHDCRTCHLPDRPGADPSEKPHNPFGARLKAVGSQLRKAGKQADIPSRLLVIADEDSDGDGVSNLLELLSGHAPGDAADKPTPAEVTGARQKRAEWETYRRSLYAWKPFEPVQRPPLPAVKRTSWVRNPIDTFLAAEQERLGLQPRPEASRAVLLRRVYLDLIGLPPTRSQQHAFLNDPAPDAYEKVVDRLLADPRYGERWGRHWMDVWRYSDWAGFGAEVRDSQKHIWHWRDWIIDSLNRDKGYDRMVQEMLAADELAPDDTDAVRATGFLVRNWYKFNRNVWLDRTIEHTSKAFLGVTLNCSRCHDHMFDPFSQQEYYAFRAIFEPHTLRTDRLPGKPDLNQDGLPRVYDGEPSAPTYLFERGDEKNPDKSHPLSPGVPAVLGGEYQAYPVVLPRDAIHPDRRAFVVAETLAASSAEAEKLRSALRAQRQLLALHLGSLGSSPAWLRIAQAPGAQQAIASFDFAEREAQLAQAKHEALLAILNVEKIEEAAGKGSPSWKQAALETARAQRHVVLLEARRATQLARREHLVAPAKGKTAAAKKLADAEAQLVKVELAAREPLTPAYTPRSLPTYPATSTGRRLALAHWITNAKNPLAARVAMNHIWLRHFGRALVPTEFDFGRNGRPPSHPALLDWLAAEFMERHWSIKQMHKLLVTSTAYRLDSRSGAGTENDPDNRLLWRMNPKRMEAEVVRDSILWLSGQLDLTRGGPDLDQSLGLTIRRRSLYFRHAAEKQMDFLVLFDAANVSECYRRTESVVPQQALALANSSLLLTQSRRLAYQLSQEVGPDNPAFIAIAFEQILNRPVTTSEQSLCLKFLAEQTARLTDKKNLTPFASGPTNPLPPAADPALRAREDLIHVLFNHNDFVSIR
jgi:hypothetical protein